MHHELRKHLTRYWIEFEPSEGDQTWGIFSTWGCGVTAFTFEEALGMLQEKTRSYGELPEIKQVTEDVDIRTLDQNHVVPNMGDVTIPGVWWPLG